MMTFKKKKIRMPIGLRTAKTVAAVLISMVIVDAYGASSAKLIFAMLGAMAAVQPTFKESLTSCFSQIVGVLFGAAVGVTLLSLGLPQLATIGIGIALVITLYNWLRIKYPPSLPCLILVMLCTIVDIHPLVYALGRIWDTAIGLGVGMAINMLIFPYDNSRQIRAAVESLDRDVLTFLEELLDGDDVVPDAKGLNRDIATMAAQLKTFSNQKLVMRLAMQKKQLETFRICEEKAREMLAWMEVLSHMGKPGRLNRENRERLAQAGANIRDQRPLEEETEQDVVTNYHVSRILALRSEMLEALGNTGKSKKDP